MGAGGVGKGVAAAARGAKAAERELEKVQRSRNTRTQRDAIDRALVDLAGFYRDTLVVGAAAEVPLTHPDHEGEIRRAATEWTAESVLRRLEAVLSCRAAMDQNVKTGDRGRGDDDGPAARLRRCCGVRLPPTTVGFGASTPWPARPAAGLCAAAVHRVRGGTGVADAARTRRA